MSAPKLSTRLGDIQDILATARHLGEAIFMAATAIGDRDQCNAIQSVCDEMSGKMRIVDDRLDEIREELA
jgi:hypothetical protein